MDEPLVTALVPLKDFVESYLRNSLASLLQQSSPRWRGLVIVEPEDRAAFVELLARELEDPRLSLIVNSGNNLGGAFNSGMRLAETEFVAVLLGDDLWSPDAVGVLTERIENHPEVDFFHSSRAIIDDDGDAVSPILKSRADVDLKDFVRGAPVKHLLCWRRSAALSFGGMDESKASVGPDDFDLPWTMAEQGIVFRAIPECLYYYRDHRSGFRLTTHLPQSAHRKELRRIFRKHGLSRLQIERRLSQASRSYLRECLYRSDFDRWVKERIIRRPPRVWRQPYV